MLPIAAENAAAISVQQRPLPAVPTPCTIGIPTPVENVCPGSQRNKTPNSQDGDGSYTFFFRQQPAASPEKRALFHDSRSRSSTLDTSSSDDDIYSEPYCAIQLKSTSKGMLAKQLVRVSYGFEGKLAGRRGREK